MVIAEGDRYIDTKTGEVLDPREWIIHDLGTRITKVKRISDKQLKYIKFMEYKLGYKPVNHENMPAFKATGLVKRLQQRLEKKSAAS